MPPVRDCQIPGTMMPSRSLVTNPLDQRVLSGQVYCKGYARASLRREFFTNQGLIMIFHPHYRGVTIHRPEDVDISYSGEPVAAGYREITGNCFW